MIIAIDGHSSCGKSTIAKSLAKKLGYTYIDTGAMYRAVTLYCMQNNLISESIVDQESLKSHLNAINIEFLINPVTKEQETFLNGKNIEREIRSLDVSEQVSTISAIYFVREKLVLLQQEFGKNGNIVMDGRDIGTVVFPKADLKIFVTASAEVRAQRRYKELTEKGETVLFSEILKNIETRDYKDTHRAESPLKKAEDAILLDNSNMTKEEQLDWILKQLP